VYFALLQEREEKGIKDVAISRIEQLSPFPYDIVSTCTESCEINTDYKSVRSLHILTSIPTPIYSGVKYVHDSEAVAAILT
jgi:hypothetical protein